ncbi:MAG TPA: lytic transglycosylase domain-containing protein [Longimicrobium sp.]
MNSNESNRGPRVSARSRFRNDTKSLLTSRPVQALLLLGAVVEGAVIMQRHGEPRPVQAASAQEAIHEALSAPIKVVPAPKLAKLEDLRVESTSEGEKREAVEAKRLAERYRKSGFKVSDRLALQIAEAAQENGISPEVAFGLVKTESGFKTSATSHVGAIGLTQLMPATARWLKPGTTRSDLRDTETNLSIGFKYLADLIEKYDGNTKLALLAYNRGPGTVDRLLKRGRNPDNGYADMVYGRRNSHK